MTRTVGDDDPPATLDERAQLDGQALGGGELLGDRRRPAALALCAHRRLQGCREA